MYVRFFFKSRNKLNQTVLFYIIYIDNRGTFNVREDQSFNMNISRFILRVGGLSIKLSDQKYKATGFKSAELRNLGLQRFFAEWRSYQAGADDLYGAPKRYIVEKRILKTQIATLGFID